MGSCGNGRLAGPNTTLAPSATSNVDWWHGHSRWCVCWSYSATGQPTWVQILEYATIPSYDEPGRCSERMSSGSSLTSRMTALAFSEIHSPLSRTSVLTSGIMCATEPTVRSAALSGRPSGSVASRMPLRHRV